MGPHMHPFSNSSPRGTGGKINNFMGLAVLVAPEDTVNNTLCMAGSPVPKYATAKALPAAEKTKTLQHFVILEWL